MRELVLIALFAAVITISAWIAVPAAIPFTMQIFAVFLTAALLGAKCGTAAVAVYILLGCVGLPVFSGFMGGVGVLFSAKGGYITGFIPAALCCALLKKRLRGVVGAFLSMLAGLAICYAFGSLWYCAAQGVTLSAALITCVLPFAAFDLAKIALAAILSQSLGKHICLK